MSAYDIHQRLRTKAIRQLRKKSYDEAIETIADGAVSMLEQKEQGSGCDLGVYLVEIYEQSGKPFDKEARENFVKIISLAQNDFWRKKVIDASVRWSVHGSRNPAGDSQFRLAIAEIMVKEESYYLAEQHFIAACIPPPAGSTSDPPAHAPKSFALSTVEWIAEYAKQAADLPGEKRDADILERIEAGRFALRGLIPLLALQAPQAARGYLSILISRLSAKHASLLLPVQPNPRPYSAPAGAETAPSPPRDLQLYVTANPELNFGQMALALSLHANAAKASSGGRVPDGLKNAWIGLVRQFQRESDVAHDEAFAEAVSKISKDSFSLQPQRQGNFMADMLSSLMGGAPPGGSGAAGASGQITDGAAAAAAAPVQALVIKQLPKPEIKEAEEAGGQEGEGGDEEGESVEVPEEEDLD